MESSFAHSEQLQKATSDLKLAAQLLAERFAKWREIYGAGRTAAMQLAPTTRDGEQLALVIAAGGFIGPIVATVGDVADFGSAEIGASVAQAPALPRALPLATECSESLH